MLDIHAALEVLPQTKEIHIVAIKNEVKELLFILKNEYHEPTLDQGHKLRQHTRSF